MAWIEVHQSLSNHIKTMRLKNILKVHKAEAVGVVLLLWLWAVDNAPSGDLSEIKEEDLREVCDFRGKASLFDVLIEAGFLNADKSIHDWQDYAGKLAEKRKADAKRKREERNRPKDIQRTSNGHPMDIHKTSEAHPMDVHTYTTQQYSTVQNSTKNTPFPPAEKDPENPGKDEVERLRTPERSEEDIAKDEKLRGCSDCYFQTNRKPMPMAAVLYVQGLIGDGVDPELVKYAIATAQGKSNPASYFMSILRDKLGKGIRTREQLLAAGEGFQVPNKSYYSDPAAYENVSMDDRKGVK